ncbi:MAG: helix-turn-helix domain-containing protein [Phocaeicola sp.]
MDNHMKQIAQRLQGLRESLDLTVQEVAKRCQLTEEQYMKLESGTADVSVSTLQTVARSYGLPLETVMFGEEPKMNSYFLTRKNTGVSIERTKAYQYQSLASGFRNRKVAPLLVTVEPKPVGTPLTCNSHQGQEFIYVIQGEMQLHINGKNLVLGEGDSVYIDSTLPHGMQALNNATLQFLTVVI